MYPIEVLTAEGETTGKEVEVYIDFTISVDNAYGADADGNRGERRVEYDVQNVYVQPEVERTLLAEELAPHLPGQRPALHLPDGRVLAPSAPRA